MILAGELLAAFVGGALLPPVALVAWLRWFGGKRWLLQKALGPLAGAMAAAPTVKANPDDANLTRLEGPPYP